LQFLAKRFDRGRREPTQRRCNLKVLPRRIVDNIAFLPIARHQKAIRTKSWLRRVSLASRRFARQIDTGPPILLLHGTWALPPAGSREDSSSPRRVRLCGVVPAAGGTDHRKE